MELLETFTSAQNGLYVAAIIAAGLGVAFMASDWRTPSSRWMAMALFAAGIGIGLNAYVLTLSPEALPWWVRLLGFSEALAFVCGVEWGIRVGRTASENRREKPRLWGPSRFAEALILGYALISAAFPAQRLEHFIGALHAIEALSVWFWIFVSLPLVAFGLIFFAAARMLRQRPDKAEAGRIVSMLVVLPLLAVSFIVPIEYAALTVALSEVVFIFGALRYFMVQGARGQFMSRFMAPQVADLVRERGLRHAMKQRRVVATIVSVDIRGFTAYAQSVEPEIVMRLLRDFYAAVGTATERYGGTIKDLAGDGVLIVIGAPVSMPDHASRALQLARRLQTHARPVVRRYSEKMGMGVGVATGEVAVGIVGQRARFEYVAVGPAVNLAARLCDKARDGEIRCDALTLDMAGEKAVGRPLRRYVKGMREPVATYILHPTPVGNASQRQPAAPQKAGVN